MTRRSRHPEISVALATFNGARYLPEQLASILGQTYSDFELVVSDDGSTDETRSILKESARDRRVRILPTRNRLGLLRNFERAIAACRGSFIALADQDDIWDANKLRRLRLAIGDADLVYSDARLIDGDGALLASSMAQAMRLPRLDGRPWKELIFFNFVTGCTSMFRRSVFLRAVPFPEDALYHDWWLAFVAARGAGIVRVSEPLVDYRLHSTNHTGLGSYKTLSGFLSAFSPAVQKAHFERLLTNVKSWIASGRLSNEELVLARSAVVCYGEPTASFGDFLLELVRHRRLMFVSNSFLTRTFKLLGYAAMWPLRKEA